MGGVQRRVEFRLTMPGVASWDGKWSGEGRNYVIYETLSAAEIEHLSIPTSWRYAWDDGWCAEVRARVMEKGERKQKSDGFNGYDWMVRNILRWDTPACQHEWRPRPYLTGELECCWCRSTRLLWLMKEAL